MDLSLAKTKSIGVFITSHWFGHATRTCAVLNEISKVKPTSFVIFSTLPHWFFSQNLNYENFELVCIKTDVGLVQNSPFAHDLEETCLNLKSFSHSMTPTSIRHLSYPRKEIRPDNLWYFPLRARDSFQVGHTFSLIENFTWGWKRVFKNTFWMDKYKKNQWSLDKLSPYSSKTFLFGG